MQHLSQHSVSVVLGYALLDYLKQNSVDVQAFLKPFELDLAFFDEQDNRIDSERYIAMYQAAADLLKDDNLGLHVGLSIKPGYFGALGYAIMSCQTLGQALQKHIKYQALVGSIGKAQFSQEDGLIHLAWQADGQQVNRHVAEKSIASWVSFARWITQQQLLPTQVQFQHSAPRDLAQHDAFFNCPIIFESQQTSISFAADYLQLPLLKTDHSLLDLMETHLEQALQKLQYQHAGLESIRDAIVAQLDTGQVDIEHIAKQLALSSRSLQRKLQAQGTSFKQLLDDIRYELAQQYLKNDQLLLVDIAFLLGFAEQSSFQRAFKRWSGQTPKQFRMQ